MAVDGSEWVKYALDTDDPNRIKTPDELIDYINKVGFLPLFKNDIDGFSVEEHTAKAHWWCEDEAIDPWEWRKILARSKKVVYGKFFGNKAGYISLDMFQRFANYRRDGYDFDSRKDEGTARHRSIKIMSLFETRNEMISYEIKQEAGFIKGGDKNFEGIITELQMQTYLIPIDFRRRLNKKGQPYGWGIALFSMPETVFGYDFVTGAYKENPAKSKEEIINKIKKEFPTATDKEISKLI